MSGLKTLRNKTSRARKGISPVIATVILVAVAVVIAAALAGFSSSLFGTYSSAGSAVTVKSIAVHENGDGDLTMLNSGNVLDEIVSIQVLPNAPVTAFTAGTTEIAPGGETIVGGITGLDGGAGFTAGQQVTVKMIMKSGLQLTQSVIVTA